MTNAANERNYPPVDKAGFLVYIITSNIPVSIFVVKEWGK